MRKAEIEQFKKDLWERIYTKGMPINIRDGINSEIADWAVDVAEDYLKEDTPQGVLESEHGFKCPACKKTIGTSGFYCKWCGVLLREVLY